MSSATTNYLSKNIVKDGTVISVSEALAPNQLTDEKGNTITFTDPLPKYYLESNGYAYSLEGLDKALVTLRISKLPEEQEKSKLISKLSEPEHQQQKQQTKSNQSKSNK